MDEQALNQLLTKFTANQLTREEHQVFTDWLNSAPEHEVKHVLAKYAQYFENQSALETDKHDALFDKIALKLDTVEEESANESSRNLRWNKLRSWSAAAVLLIIGSLSIYYYKSSISPAKQRAVVTSKKSKIIPGTNKAVLTLANGDKIDLDNAANGTLAVQNTYSVNKLKDGQLVYKPVSGSNSYKTEGYNTLTTPRGGQYNVVLPDGTKVWLNAASSIKYEAAFAGKQRRVTLLGEAYFEVAKNERKPFIVSFNNTEVKVLGTHFNIMSYTDEPKTHTTLLEGSIMISNGLNSKTIVPGEQAAVGNKICVLNVDTAQVVGWKNGSFTFSHEKIKTVMNKIARWYDVDIEYDGPVTQEDFIGTIPRSKNLTEVLHKLELTGLLHFKIKERRVIVMR